MKDSPEILWPFIRNIYIIFTLQLLFTVAVAAATVTGFADFFISSTHGFVLYFAIVITALIVWGLLHKCYKYRPLNYILLAIFTITFAFSIGLANGFMEEMVILEAKILSVAATISLTLYTCWAQHRDHKFRFIGLFFLSASMVLILFGLIQVLFPLGELSVMIYGCLVAIVFCAYIVWNTYNIIDLYSKDKIYEKDYIYIRALASLYFEITSFFSCLTCTSCSMASC